MALRLKPTYAEANNNLGYALYSRGDLDGAISDYRTALHINPQYSTAHYNLGLALERQGDHKAALEEFRAASTLEPGNPLFRQKYEQVNLKH